MTALLHAWRALRRNPRLTVPVVVLLGLAAGATGAAFSLVHSILLRPLPYPEPDRLMMVWSAPPDLRQPEPLLAKEPQYWVPLAVQPWMANRGAHALRVIGRLRRGVEPSAAQAEMTALAGRIHAEHEDAEPGARVVPLHRQLVGDLRPGLLMLMAAMAALWLAACANAGNQVLTYRLHRDRDLQLRVALGAGRGLLVAQAACEGLLLGLAAAVPGLLLGAWGGGLLARAFPVVLPGLEPARFDLAAVGATVVLACGSGLAASTPVALRLAGRRRFENLNGRGSSAGRGAAWVRGVLLTAEVALALPLVAGAGILAQSLVRLRDVDPGFRAGKVTSFSLTLPADRDPGRAQQATFYAGLVEELAHAPGVGSAGVIASLPLSGVDDRELGVEAEGGGARRGLTAHYQVVSPGTLAALGIPLLAGRAFGAADGPTGSRVAIVSRALARLVWPGQEAVGHRVSFDYGAGAAPRWMTVIGVAGDVRQEGLANSVTPVLYRPLGQDAMEGMAVVVRGAVGGAAPPAAELKAAVHRLDARLALADLRPLGRLVDGESARLRFLSVLVEAVALVTLLVAVVGIVGLMGYLNRLRRREMAIRVALGAGRAEVVRCLVAPVVCWLGLGAALGVVAALAMRSLLAGVVFGVGPADPVTLGGACLLILGLGAAAAYVPSRATAQVRVNEELQQGE